MKVEFEKQFGKGVDPWYEKANRWAKKQKFPISFLALGLIAYLKKVWINTKIKNEIGFNPRYTTKETLLSFVGADRLRQINLIES